MLGPGEGVAEDEMNVLRQVRDDGRDDFPLDRAHICYRGPGADGANFAGYLTHCPNRHAQHHEVRALYRFGGRVADHVAQAVSRAIAQVSADRAEPEICPARPPRRIAWIIEEAIRPSPINATLS